MSGPMTPREALDAFVGLALEAHDRAMRSTFAVGADPIASLRAEVERHLRERLAQGVQAVALDWDAEHALAMHLASVALPPVCATDGCRRELGAPGDGDGFCAECRAGIAEMEARERGTGAP